MKLYIVGSVASGKSTLARRISKITGIPCYHLDEVMHIVDLNEVNGNRRRSVEERDALFADILAEDNYIIEDVGRECFAEGMRMADTVILLDIPIYILRKRIILRWIKQNLDIEKCKYKPNFGMLKNMFRWAKNYDAESYIAPYHDKTVIIRNNKDLKQYLNKLKLNGK